MFIKTYNLFFYDFFKIPHFVDLLTFVVLLTSYNNVYLKCLKNAHLEYEMDILMI